MITQARASVVMATRNRAHLLAQVVQSILDQTERAIELIIVDDFSKDGTPGVLQELARCDARIHMIRTLQQLGPGKARNLGIENAKAGYVAIMDDDDNAVADRLSTQCDVLDADGSLGLVFSTVTWLTDEGEIVFPGVVECERFPADPDDIFRLLLLESNKIPNPTILARRDLLRAFPYPNLTWGEDWLLMLQMSARGVRMRGLPQPLVRMRRQSGHDSLMSRREDAFASQRLVLRTIKEWLAKEDIHRFDSIHAHALSNQLTREARYWSGTRGLSLCLRALAAWPGNPVARRTVTQIVGRGWRRVAQRNV